MKSFIALLVILSLAAGSVSAAGPAVVKSAGDVPAYKVLAPEFPTPAPRVARLHAPKPRPTRDDYIGLRDTVGDTYYDYQTNGCVGKMIALDNYGDVHFTWMDGWKGPNNVPNEVRHQKYNFLEYTDDGPVWLQRDGLVVDVGTRSGYGCLALTTEAEQRAMVFCHVLGAVEGLAASVGIDMRRGWGAFQSSYFPSYPDTGVAWPQGAMSPAGKLHTVSNKAGAQMLSYASGYINGEGMIQIDQNIPTQIEQSHLNAYRIAADKNSERAAITWMRPRAGIPAPPEWERFLAYQINNDLMVAYTDDGDDWNFDNPLNVTNCLPIDPQNEDTIAAMGDTLRPFCTHDVIFDPNGYMHIVFEARGMWQKPIYDPDNPADQPPIKGLTIDASFLFIWSEETGEVSPVADGWFTQQVRLAENDSLIIWPTPGAWKSNVCNPSLAYAPNGDLYCVYNYYPRDDYNNYVDQGASPWDVGRCNGDIAVTVSEDNGRSWYYPTMVTETSTPLAEAGDAMCEEYPTVADLVNDTLHIFYELDTEAGTKVGQDEAGASVTLCQFFYHRVPTSEVHRDSIWEGPNFHTGDYVPPDTNAVADRGGAIARGFGLTSVSPNPFNSQAVSSYKLQVSSWVKMGLYDLNGKLVQTLAEGWQEAGSHQAVIDGTQLSSGLYLVKLTAGRESAVMKAALLK